MPKWGASKSGYFFNKDDKVIAKGLASVKYIGVGLAEELYDISQRKHYEGFVDLLCDVSAETSLDSRQLDILIKLDFFSEFGNQRELFRISEMFSDLFKSGSAKKISRDKVDGTPLEPVIKKYAVGVTKSGGEAKSYTLLDLVSIMREAEDIIKGLGLKDLDAVMKARNFSDIMGYAGYVSWRQEDRAKLYVVNVIPLKRKKDGKRFGYSVITKSIGSGKESRFTVFNSVFDRAPIQRDDIILCTSYVKEGEYFKMTSYEKLT